MRNKNSDSVELFASTTTGDEGMLSSKYVLPAQAAATKQIKDTVVKEANEALDKVLRLATDGGIIDISQFDVAMDALAVAQHNVQQAYINSLSGSMSEIIVHIEAVAKAHASDEGYTKFRTDAEVAASTYEGFIENAHNAAIRAIPQYTSEEEKELVDALRQRAKEAHKLSRRGFYSYRAYLYSLVGLQFYAIEQLGLPLEEAETLLDDLAAQRYKPRARKQETLRFTAQQADRLGMFLTPSGNIARLLHDATSLDGDPAIQAYKQRRERNRKVKVSVTPAINNAGEPLNFEGRTITVQTSSGSDSSKIALTIDSLKNQIFGADNPMAAFVTLSLSEAAAQCVVKGELVKAVVSFPLRKLVDLGMYSSTDAARHAFRKASDWLTSVKIYAESKTKK